MATTFLPRRPRARHGDLRGSEAVKSSSVTVGRIARILDVDRTKLYELASRVDQLYTHSSQRNGKKRRIISAPRGELKKIQQGLLRGLLLSLPVSDAAYAVTGRGVVKHAARHRRKAHLLSLDIADCFPSTKVSMIVAALKRNGFREDAAALTARLITVKGALPQGAPTSSAMLEVVLNDLDQELTDIATLNNADYSRFADDLCFSGPTELHGVARHAARAVRRYGYLLNRKKQRKSRPGVPHVVTGIAVGEDLRPTPEFMRRLRSDLATGSPRSAAKARSLRGKLAWVEGLRRESKGTPKVGERS